MTQAPKKLREITVRDNRGTSITLRVFLSDISTPDYVKELVGLWQSVYGGQADSFEVDGAAFDFTAKTSGIHNPK